MSKTETVTKTEIIEVLTQAIALNGRIYTERPCED